MPPPPTTLTAHSCILDFFALYNLLFFFLNFVPSHGGCLCVCASVFAAATLTSPSQRTQHAAGLVMGFLFFARTHTCKHTHTCALTLLLLFFCFSALLLLLLLLVLAFFVFTFFVCFVCDFPLADVAVAASADVAARSLFLTPHAAQKQQKNTQRRDEIKLVVACDWGWGEVGWCEGRSGVLAAAT